MKTCSQCNETLSLEEFQNKARSKDGKHNMCKPCKRGYDKQYYQKTPSRVQYLKEASEAQRREAIRWVWDYLADHPCVDCGESDPIILEFDHVQGIKIDSISALTKKGSIKNIELEITKCQVRCCNCHRRMTATRGNWYSYL
jgi:hypothetical protein